jgi:hypothetical protein
MDAWPVGADGLTVRPGFWKPPLSRHEAEQARRGAGQELPRGPRADQEAHDQPEVVAGDVHQVTLLEVLPTTQPGPAHAAAVEGQREAALAQLGPKLECFLGHPERSRARLL